MMRWVIGSLSWHHVQSTICASETQFSYCLKFTTDVLYPKKIKKKRDLLIFVMGEILKGREVIGCLSPSSEGICSCWHRSLICLSSFWLPVSGLCVCAGSAALRGGGVVHPELMLLVQKENIVAFR